MFTHLKGRHWKILGLAAVVFVALASSVYAYWRINVSPTLYVTATSHPLELRMELDKTEFQLNETVAIHLSLKNIGNETIRMFFPHEGNTVGFIVKDVNNIVVYDYPYSGFTSIGEAILEPGGRISKTFHWSQIGIYPDGSGDVYLDSVPPGTYRITGRTELFSIVDSSELIEHWTPRIETSSITSTIG